MNTCLIFLAGLATLTLTYAPAALANPSVETASLPRPTVPSANAILSENQPPIQPRIHSNIQSGIQSNAQIYSEFRPLPSIAEAPPIVPSPALSQTPAASGDYVPLAPAVPALSDAQLDAQYATPIPSDLGLQFDLSNSAPAKKPPASPPVEPAPVPPAPPPIAAAPATPPAKPTDFSLGDLFAGGSDSLVAIVVGSAEGTRSPDGKPNEHFYGHPDPGNGVWNLGTFSYQHGAASPEEADIKQLKRLKQQAQIIQEKATANGLRLTLEETLNAIDLANQAPKAVIDGEGYVEWLAKAYQIGKSGAEAILWARVQSFIDPKTQRWDAPGLGNTADNIIHDQQRRMDAIDRAIAAQNYQIASDARLRSQPIGFRLPRWNFAGQIIQKVATLFN